MVRMLNVLIVDESAVVQRQLSGIINADKHMRVVGVASDPYMARAKIKLLKPDILTLDVALPKMDGITFLRNLMRLRPMPVLMVIDAGAESSGVVETSRDIGAKGVFIKNSIIQGSAKQSDAKAFLAEIRKAANVKEELETPVVGMEKQFSADAILQYSQPTVFKSTESLIAVGASTGGTEAIRKLIVGLPENVPAIVVTQHIPGKFSAAFADRINRLTPLKVAEAKDGEIILPGHVYIAPGDQHLVVQCVDSRYQCSLNDGPPVNRHKPSVDVLFRSVAQSAGPNAIGVLLTGMGSDGAVGLLEMKKNHAATLVQDEATSVVWGMPGSAVKMGAADEVLPLDKIAEQLLGKLNKQITTDKVKEFARMRRFKS